MKTIFPKFWLLSQNLYSDLGQLCKTAWRIAVSAADRADLGTVRPRTVRFFVPEKVRVDRNVLDRGSSYAMECKIVKKTAS